MKGQGRQSPHLGKDIDEEQEMFDEAWTTWSMDYCFLTEEMEVVTTQEVGAVERERIKDTVLVCEDKRSGGVRSHLVQCTGVGDDWTGPPRRQAKFCLDARESRRAEAD